MTKIIFVLLIFHIVTLFVMIAAVNTLVKTYFPGQCNKYMKITYYVWSNIRGCISGNNRWPRIPLGNECTRVIFRL